MSLRESPGVVIIPALLRNHHSIIRLQEAIISVPADLNCSLIVVVQGDEKALHRYSANRALRDHVLVQAEPRGKWEAVVCGLRHVAETQQWVVVFDGDAAFDGGELRGLINLLIWQDVHHVIGQRQLPSLTSRDQRSAHTRIFLEAYFNTLILLSLGEEAIERYRGLDVQCGLQGFKLNWLRSIMKHPMPFYGGEAILFYESAKVGVPAATVSVRQRQQRSSSYTVEQVVAQLLQLDFIKEVSTDKFELALELAITCYAHWITDCSRFRSEIQQLVLSHIWAKYK